MNNLKAVTRKRQGAGGRRKHFGSGRTPRILSSFICEDDNTMELFKFRTDRIATLETYKNYHVTQSVNPLCYFNTDTSHAAIP